MTVSDLIELLVIVTCCLILVPYICTVVELLFLDHN